MAGLDEFLNKKTTIPGLAEAGVRATNKDYWDKREKDVASNKAYDKESEKIQNDYWTNPKTQDLRFEEDAKNRRAREFKRDEAFYTKKFAGDAKFTNLDIDMKGGRDNTYPLEPISSDLRSLIKQDQFNRSPVGKTKNAVTTFGGATKATIANVGGTAIDVGTKTKQIAGLDYDYNESNKEIAILNKYGAEAAKSYVRARDKLKEQKLLDSQDNGFLQNLSNKKTELEALRLGGMPKDKVVYKEIMGYVKDKKTGEPVLVGTGEYGYQIEKAKIIMPVKNKYGWSNQYVDATPQNVRLALDAKRKFDADTNKKEADTEAKLAEAQNIRSLMNAREIQIEQSKMYARPGSVRFGSKNFGREPIYLNGSDGGQVRSKYLINLAPSVQSSLQVGKVGMLKMSDRVFSGFTGKEGPSGAFGKPTGVGDTNLSVLSKLSPKGGNGILSKLSPKRKY